MSASALIDLAVKLKVGGSDSDEYINSYIECVTTHNDKRFIIPISNEAQIRVLDNVDWINQGGSESKNEQIDKELSSAILDGKTKKIKPSNTFAAIRVTKYSGDISKRSKSVILGLINDKLTAQVKKNMVYPKLVNRTGRFASSAKVMDVKETEKGYLSLVYTWQATPYGVFSKYYGKLPWATPERDPDDLVKLSIGQLIYQYYKDKVYYRRDW